MRQTVIRNSFAVFFLGALIHGPAAAQADCPNVKGAWEQIFQYPSDYQHTKSLNFVERSQFLDVSTFTSERGTFDVTERLPLDGSWVKIDHEKGDRRYRAKRLYCADNRVYIVSEYRRKGTDEVLSFSLSYYELTGPDQLHWSERLTSSRDHEFQFDHYFVRKN